MREMAKDVDGIMALVDDGIACFNLIGDFEGPVTPPAHSGFGTSIMENIIAGQLSGEVRFDWRAKGLTCEIALPVAPAGPPRASQGCLS